MKPFLHPVPIACLLLAVMGGVMGQLPMMALALVAGIASLGLLSARHTQNDQKDGSQELSADSRILVRPVKKLVADIEGVLAANKDSQTIRIIGGEALAESQALMSQVLKSLVARDALKKSLKGRYEAEREVSQARMKLEFAGEAEKASLNAAIDARKLELSHYDEIEKQLKQIEVGVNQAEAALAEMKARLSLSASSERAALGEGDDLRETLARMKNLNESYEESARLIEGT